MKFASASKKSLGYCCNGKFKLMIYRLWVQLPAVHC